MANIETVEDFWTKHINNEYYTQNKRGTQKYFREIERKRYKHHYHLKDLFRFFRTNPKFKGKKMLEIGCGIGIDSVQLHKCGFKLTAIDLTKSAIKIAKERAKYENYDIDYQIGNAEKLQFKEGSFDYVFSFGVLHHTPNIKKSIAEVYRVLKKGGEAYIMLYSKHSLVNAIHKIFRIPYESPKNMKDRCPVVYTFSKKDLKKMFRYFSSIKLKKEYPFTYGFRLISDAIPLFIKRPLGELIGWHWMIKVRK